MGQAKSLGKFAVIVESNRLQRVAIDNLLQSSRMTVVSYDALTKAQRALFHLGKAVEVLIIDIDLDQEPTGMEWLVRVKDRFPHLQIVVVSDHGGDLPERVRVLHKHWQPLDLLRAVVLSSCGSEQVRS